MTIAIVEQPFNIDESINLIHQLELRGTEFNVRCGLELLRVKMSIDHGYWYGFLLKAGIFPSTATRRMKTASLFLGWIQTKRMEENMAIASVADISMSISPPDGHKPTRAEILEGINIIYQEPCKLHDFNEAQKIDIDKFWNEIPQQDNKYSPPRDRIFIVQLNPAWKKIEGFILHKYKRLPTREKLEVREWLQMQADRASALIQLIQDMDEAVPTTNISKDRL
jgi:hypothetical protein